MFTTYKPACLALSATVFLLSVPAFALDPAAKPKLGPDAIPVTQDHAYLRTAEAPDYWAMSPFYLPQQTNAACSLASIAVAMNTLRGLPPASDDTLITQDNLLETVANPVWSEQAKQDGDGVKFADLLDAVSKSTQALGIEAEVSSVQPASDEAATLDAFRAVLENASAVELKHEVETEAVTVRTRMLVVMDLLESHESIEFTRIFEVDGESGPPSRAVLVATFLAILELARLTALRIYQGISDRGTPEGPIRCRRATVDAETPEWRERITDTM